MNSNRAQYKRFADKADETRFIFENIEFALNRLDETLQDMPDINIVWSDKLKVTAGTASRGKIINISNELWERGNIEQRKEIIIHETCHLVVQTRNIRGDYKWLSELEKTEISKRRGHGMFWENCMIECGYINPRICHTIQVVRRKFLWVCKCSEHKIKVRLHNQALKLGALQCKLCGEMCRFVGEVKE